MKKCLIVITRFLILTCVSAFAAYNESGQESVKCPGQWWNGAWRRPLQ